MKEKRGILLFFLRLSVSGLIIYFLFRKVQPEKLIENLRSFPLSIWLLTFVIFLFIQFFSSLRWKILAEDFNVKESIPFLFACTMAGNFFSLFLPGTVTGDVVKLFYLKGRGHAWMSSTVSVAADRALGFVSLVMLLALTLLDPELKNKAVILHHLAPLCWIGAAFLLTFPVWCRILIKLFNEFKVLQSLTGFLEIGAGSFYAALAISLSCHVLSAEAHRIISGGLGLNLSLWFFLFAIPAVSILTAIPISVHGIGIREGGFVWVLGLMGVEPEKALALSITGYSVSIAVGLLGGLVYLFLRGSKNNRKVP